MAQENDISLEQKLRGWLETQGYPLEMRVAKAFQTAGARVVQSDYYTDPSTDESREIDVIADWEGRVEKTLVRISFVVECKTSKDRPWVLFVSRDLRLKSHARVAQRAASRLGRQVLLGISTESSAQDLPIFKLPESPAYSVTQAFTSGRDVCYAAASAVANACFALTSEGVSLSVRRTPF